MVQEHETLVSEEQLGAYFECLEVGLGDWVMSSAQVKEANERTGKKVMLGDGVKYYYENQVFKNNPRMAKPGEDCVWVANYGGNRPYIRGSIDKHFVFNDDWKPTPGELWLGKDEEIPVPDYPYIVVEPEVKNKFAHGVNKAWPTEYWSIVSKEPLPFIQLGTTNTPIFPLLRTDTFRQALSILSKASLFVGTDGALHHAAAALGIPAVVIWTGFSSPRHLGYDSHVNLHDGGEPCGFYGGTCEHCKAIAKNLHPNRVLEAVYEEYSRSVATGSRTASGSGVRQRAGLDVPEAQTRHGDGALHP